VSRPFCQNEARLWAGGLYESAAAFMAPIDVFERTSDGAPTEFMELYSIAAVTGVSEEAIGPQIFTERSLTAEHSSYARVAEVAITRRSSRSLSVTGTRASAAEDSNRKRCEKAIEASNVGGFAGALPTCRSFVGARRLTLGLLDNIVV